jgi:hypothetical protein
MIAVERIRWAGCTARSLRPRRWRRFRTIPGGLLISAFFLFFIWSVDLWCLRQARRNLDDDRFLRRVVRRPAHGIRQALCIGKPPDAFLKSPYFPAADAILKQRLSDQMLVIGLAAAHLGKICTRASPSQTAKMPVRPVPKIGIRRRNWKVRFGISAWNQ